MLRWASCGLVLVGTVASAQSDEAWKRALADLRGEAINVRPNPFGEPLPQWQLPAAGPQFVAAPAPPGPGLPGTPAVSATPGPAGPQPTHPVFTLPGAPKLDRHGDPLPAGAVARFGTIRLRHGSDIQGMGFTQDGKRLCTVSETGAGGVRLWDVESGKEVARLNTPARLVGLARDGSVVIVDDTRIKVWFPATNTVRGMPEKTLPEGATPSALAVNPDARSFALATGGKVLLIDAVTGKTLKELNLPAGPANNPNPGAPVPPPNPNPPPAPAVPPVKLLYSPDGRWLLGNGMKTGVWLWDLRTGKRVRTYRTEADFPEYTFSPDVTKIAVTGEQMQLYSLDSEEPVDGFKAPEGVLFYAPRFADDGKTLFGIEQDGEILPLDAVTGEAQKSLEAPEMELRPPFALAPGGVRAAAVDQTGGIRIWDPKTGKGPEVTRFPPLADPGFAAGGKSATVIDQTNKVHAFDPATGAPGATIELPDGDNLLPATWDPASRRAALLVSTGAELEVHVIDADTKKVLSKHAVPPTGEIPFVAFAGANRDRLALFTQTGVVVVNPTTGKTVRSLNTGPIVNGPRGAISPDGRLVAVHSRPLTVWEVSTGKKRLSLDAAPNADAAMFGPDSRHLVAWDQAGNVVIVDLRTGSIVRRFPAADTTEGVAVLALSPNGKRLAAGGLSGRVTVWDVTTGDTLAPFAGHDGLVTGLVFTSDGKRLVSSSQDGTALVWEIPERPLPTGPAEAVVTGFDEAFRLIASTDAAQAQRGLEYLYRRPAEAVKEVGTRLPVPTAVSTAKLAQYVADLESDEFATREAAVKALARAGGEAGPLLKEAVEKSPSAEVRKLASELLGRIDAAAVRTEDLKILRAVELMENLGTGEAREQLEKWAAGPAGHRLTVEAAAALARLGAVSGK